MVHNTVTSTHDAAAAPDTASPPIFYECFCCFFFKGGGGGGSLPHNKIIKSYVIPFYGPQAVHKVLNTT